MIQKINVQFDEFSYLIEILYVEIREKLILINNRALKRGIAVHAFLIGLSPNFWLNVRP